MAKISLTYANRHGHLSVCATVVGTQTRHYRIVTELVDPDFTKWDKKLQRFATQRPVDVNNNYILDSILKGYYDTLAEHEFANGRELFNFVKDQSKSKDSANPKDVEQSKPKKQAKSVDAEKAESKKAKTDPTTNGPTMKQWLEQIIQEIKYPGRLKPSSSYQVYLTLLHKLEQEGSIIDMRVSEVNDDTFRQLIKWIEKTPKKNGRGNNFIGIMKCFTATINRARKARLTTYQGGFPYMDYAPFHEISDNAKTILEAGGTVKSLSDEQYEAFLNLDLTTVKMGGGPQQEWYKELYRDFCILLHELKSRPIDVLRLHWDNIAYDEKTGRYTCAYIPAKKKNYGASARHTKTALAIQFLSKEAERIVLKYKGRSKGGYVFPFSINDTKYDFSKPNEFHYHYYKGNHVCGRINRFLHKVGEVLEIPFQLTMYAFRRTAITHAIKENRIPVMAIAKMAGTSVEMIEAHYANYLQTMAQY